MLTIQDIIDAMSARNAYRALLVLIFCLFGVTSNASFVQISWSGYLEPGSIENPWELSGDGEFGEPYDEGTPFTVSVVVSTDAPQIHDGTDNLQIFGAESARLTIDGAPAITETIWSVSVLDNVEPWPTNVYDSLFVVIDASYLGVTLRVVSTVDFDESVIDFFDPSHTGTFPVFDSAYTNRTVGAYAEGNPLATVPGGSYVSVTQVPLPGAWVLFWSGLLALRVFVGRALDADTAKCRA